MKGGSKHVRCLNRFQAKYLDGSKNILSRQYHYTLDCATRHHGPRPQRGIFPLTSYMADGLDNVYRARACAAKNEIYQFEVVLRGTRGDDGRHFAVSALESYVAGIQDGVGVPFWPNDEYCPTINW